MTRIYLASAYGFSEAGCKFLKDLKDQLGSSNREILDPWEIGAELISEFWARHSKVEDRKDIRKLREINYELAKRNQQAIDAADIVVAALDGSDVDSGTASEIGYAFAKGKKILGYRGDFRIVGENEAAIVNLQVQYWIEKSGGAVVRAIDPDLLDLLQKAEEGLANQ